MKKNYSKKLKSICLIFSSGLFFTCTSSSTSPSSSSENNSTTIFSNPITQSSPQNFFPLATPTATPLTQLKFDFKSNRIAIYRGNDTLPILVQNADANTRPFIHPILAPDGKGILTQNMPPDHPWQHGLYVGLNKVNETGFWEETDQDGSFHPAPLQSPILVGNQISWQVKTEWRDATGNTMLMETQTWKFVDSTDHFELDLDWSLQALIDITFGKYAYGGLFLRMPFQGGEESNAINSEGKLNDAAEAQKARWVDISMPISGRVDKAGITLMDHPTNPGYPSPWRVDGQLGTSPSRCIAGDWSLKKGNSTTSKYRLYIHVGDINKSKIENIWNRFSTAPSTSIRH